MHAVNTKLLGELSLFLQDNDFHSGYRIEAESTQRAFTPLVDEPLKYRRRTAQWTAPVLSSRPSLRRSLASEMRGPLIDVQQRWDLNGRLAASSPPSPRHQESVTAGEGLPPINLPRPPLDARWRPVPAQLTGHPCTPPMPKRVSSESPSPPQGNDAMDLLDFEILDSLEAGFSV